MGITSDKKLDNIKEKKYSTKWSPRSLTALTAKWLRKKSGAFLKSKHTPKHNVPSGTRRMVMTISKKLFHGRSLAVIAIFCTSVLIAACGGGGGSTDAPIGAAQVVAGAIKKADGCTIPQDGTTCSGTVTFSITGNPTAPKLVVGNTTMNTTTGATIAVPLTGTAPVALTVYDGNTVLDSKSVAAVCAVGSSWDGNACKATVTAWWPPAKVAPVGTKLINPKAPPMEGLLTPAVAGPVWQQAVRDGTIQFAETGMVLTGFSSKSLMLAFFIDPFTKNVCTTLVNKDDGSNVDTNPRTYIGCKTAPFDWVMGTSDGYIMHFPSIGKCYKETWVSSTKTLLESEVTCPQ